MNKTILDIISHMSDNSYLPNQIKEEGIWESEKTVSFQAYEYARDLKNIDDLEDLYSLVMFSTNEDEKHNVNFFIGNIARNTAHIPATKFLIEALESEKNNNNLVIILTLLSELFKPLDVDLLPIFNLTNSKNGHVRGKSYEALTNTEHKIENFLLNKLNETQNNHDIQYLLYAIKSIGTIVALPYVERYLKSRKPSIKGTAETVVALIMIREGFSNDAISSKVKYSMTIIEGLRTRLSILTKPG